MFLPNLTAFLFYYNLSNAFNVKTNGINLFYLNELDIVEGAFLVLLRGLGMNEASLYKDITHLGQNSIIILSTINMQLTGILLFNPCHQLIRKKLL